MPSQSAKVVAFPKTVMSEASLQNRDYTVILARNASQDAPALPGIEKQWLVAQDSILTLAKKCEEFDSDGLSIYIASTPIQKYEHQTHKALVELLQEGYSSQIINLADALKVALDNYFRRKASGQTKENGEIIIVLLDKEPKERMAVVKLLVEATQKMDKAEELGIMFAQVGDDLITRGFLAALDDDLSAAGAKFDIADTKVLKEMEESAITEFLLNAIHD